MLWTLALCPIVVLPPLLALFLNFRRQTPNDPSGVNLHSPDLLISIAAVCNIVLSILFWRWVGDTAVSMGLSIGLLLKSIGINHPPSGVRI